MQAITTIVPVFVMILLGLLAKRYSWVDRDQVAGLSAVIYTVFFPVMAFNAIFTSILNFSDLYLIIFVFFMHILGMMVGKLLIPLTGQKFGHISPLLMSTVDGGNVCFPLYATIVGSSYISNILLLDVAGMFIIFLVIPMLVSSIQHNDADVKVLIKRLLFNPMVVSLLSGFLLNQFGLYTLLSESSLFKVYNSSVTMITTPIVGAILFTIGYKFEINKSSLVPLLKLIFLRLGFMCILVIIMLTLFSSILKDQAMFVAVLLYFMCPPALIMDGQINALYVNKDDGAFVSAFTSTYMVVTMVVYTLIVIFIG